MSAALATIGDNNPPSDAEIFRNRMQETHTKLLDRADSLVAAEQRLPKIDGDESAGQVADFIRQLATARKALETTRVAEKEPYLSMGRTVDGYFKGITDKLDSVKMRAQKPLDEFVKAKAAEERRQREAAAEAQRLEAQRLLNEAAAISEISERAGEAALSDAMVSEQRAVKMDVDAAARPSQLATVRGAEASTSLRTRWVGKLDNRQALDLEKLAPYISDEALQKAINAYVVAGGRQLAGAVITEESTAVVR